ncbi:MAG: hypothetical protein WCJ40_08950, partial [Planctomycetota bacterium]
QDFRNSAKLNFRRLKSYELKRTITFIKHLSWSDQAQLPIKPKRQKVFKSLQSRAWPQNGQASN